MMSPKEIKALQKKVLVESQTKISDNANYFDVIEIRNMYISFAVLSVSMFLITFYGCFYLAARSIHDWQLGIFIVLAMLERDVFVRCVTVLCACRLWLKDDDKDTETP